MPFVNRGPPHPAQYYVEYQRLVPFCYQRAGPVTAHKNLQPTIEGRGLQLLVPEQHLNDADVDLLLQ